jgi:hypothetical protein
MTFDIASMLTGSAPALSGRQKAGRALSAISAGLMGQGPQYLGMIQQQDQQSQQQAQQLSKERLVAMAQDAQRVDSLLKSGDIQGALRVIDNRTTALKQLGGDPSDTLRIRQLIMSGEIPTAQAEIGQFLSAAQQAGLVKGPEVIPQSAISPTGQVAMMGADGSMTSQNIPGYQAAPTERKTAADQNGVLRYIDDGQPVFPDVQKVAETLTDKDRFDRAKVIRSEIDTANKDFTQLANSWDRIAASANSPSAAGDLALIFNFMKMLDPGSTVREGEFATAQSAAGVPDRIRSAYNRVINGERLTPEQRSDFFGQAQNIFDAADSRAASIRDEYVRLAERSGLSREDVIVDRGAAPVIDHGKIGRFTVTEIPEGQ